MKSYLGHYHESRANYINLHSDYINELSPIDASTHSITINPEWLVNHVDFRPLLRGLGLSCRRLFEKGEDIETFLHYDAVSRFDTLNHILDCVNLVVQECERNLFGSFVKAEYVQIVQNKVYPNRGGSHIWHYDDCPSMFLKCMLYLTDVSSCDGPFEYLTRTNGKGYQVPNSRIGVNSRCRQLFAGSRIPDDIIKFYSSKYFHRSLLVGPEGTACVFSPNIIHRANPPTDQSIEPRIACFLYLRPTLRKWRAKSINDLVNVLSVPDVKSYNVD